jgi:BirA family biotin operon repressor/biotin-[acetyl-CoA-carboxylase] ligase
MALASVDSTNAEAARRAGEGSAPLWIMADEQTGGRGRRGRPWSSPRGNFHATLLLHPAEPPDVVALRSFVAALALRDACVALTGLPGAFTLKWPNDVLLKGGKLAGILLEGAGQGTGMAHLAIGIGVNLIAAPDPEMVEPGALRPVSLLAETGLRVSPQRFLEALAPAYARRERTFCIEGFAPLREDWLAHAARLGQPIRARTGVATREGIFETIDSTGALLLRMPTATLAIPAAEVFF